jgi:hypothetical protein
MDKINTQKFPKKLVQEYLRALDNEVTELIKKSEKDENGLFTDKEFDDFNFWSKAYKHGNHSAFY